MISTTKKTTRLNFGPQHPATHGTLHIELDLDGESIVGITPNLGYLHTGMEKLAEHHSYNQYVTVTDRMNYLSALSNNIGYVQAVEELLGLSIPKRTQFIRVILAELSRIGDHMVCLGLSAMDLGAFSQFLYTFANRERLYDIFEEVTGGRLTTAFTRVGGLVADLPKHFESKVRKVLQEIKEAIEEMEILLTGNEIWKIRTQGVGVIDRNTAVAYACTGPILRAAGLAYDVRKARPYLNYSDFDFDIPTETSGDVWGRYLVRKAEVLESLRIIEQALDGIPVGDIQALQGKITLPDHEEVYSSIEGLIHQFKLVMDGHGIRPRGEIYSATEVPNGELGWTILADGSDCPTRLRVRPPSLYHYQVVPEAVRGRLVADMVATLSSLNIIAGELDR
jgi:NADH dehydrogenase I D subunit